MFENVLFPCNERELEISAFVQAFHGWRSAEVRGVNQTHSVNSIHLFPPFILLPLHPVLVQVIEQLVDVHGAVRVRVPFSGVEAEKLDVAQLFTLLF